jgi:DNA polymerase-1
LTYIFNILNECIASGDTQSRQFRFAVNRIAQIVESGLFDVSDALSTTLLDSLSGTLSDQAVSTDQYCRLIAILDRDGRCLPALEAFLLAEEEATLALSELDSTRRVLSSLATSCERTRPIIDVFGSRTSRVHLRSPSLQNLAKKYRTIVTASEGANLCYVDFDQYEVGIMAALSGDPELTNLYGAGDMYDLFAANYLGLEGNRKAAKQLFLSYAYGMSRQALIDAAVLVGADRERAKHAFRLFSKYEAWKKSIWMTFQRDGRIGSIQGNYYKRSGQGSLYAKEQRSAVSQVIQGTASLIFKKTLLEVSAIEDVSIKLPMHDALLFEHREENTPTKVVTVFEKVMTEHLNGRVNGKASIAQFTLN